MRACRAHCMQPQAPFPLRRTTAMEKQRPTDGCSRPPSPPASFSPLPQAQRPPQRPAPAARPRGPSPGQATCKQQCARQGASWGHSGWMDARTPGRTRCRTTPPPASPPPTHPCCSRAPPPPAATQHAACGRGGPAPGTRPGHDPPQRNSQPSAGSNVQPASAGGVFETPENPACGGGPPRARARTRVSKNAARPVCACGGPRMRHGIGPGSPDRTDWSPKSSWSVRPPPGGSCWPAQHSEF